MTAGLNCASRIIRLVYTDDEVGGSYPSGTVLHDWVDTRIDEDEPNTDFLGQGLETIKTFSFTAWGHNLTIREQDELDIISPPNHRHVGQRFRIVSLRGDSVHPAQKRAYWTGKLVRSQIAHKNEYQ